jgi:thiamine kinase-like enzyme
MKFNRNLGSAIFGMPTESLPRAADAKRITEALRQNGAITSARVCSVAATSSLKKLRSHTFRLRLEYEGAGAGAPNTIVLKIGHIDCAGRSPYSNHKEITFYRKVAPASPAGLAPRCFEAVDATDSTAWHLLLEDLTDSHFIATEWPLPPTLAQCEIFVQALARFHGAWWNNPHLGADVGAWASTEAFDRSLQIFAEKFALFSERFSEVFPPERRTLYERLLDQAPHLLGRYLSHHNLTIIHGDAHSWNFFLPMQDTNETVRLVDWEDWSIASATDDLAYMMAMLWYPDRRRRLEKLLLDGYYAELLAQGVVGYDREMLTDDYRLSALWLIMRPVWQAMNNIAPRVWRNNLERIMLAVDDLGCRDLLT